MGYLTTFSYITEGAYRLSQIMGLSNGLWLPSTVAAFKINFNSLIIISLLLILLICDLYAFVQVFQTAINKVVQIVQAVLNRGTSHSVILAGLVFLVLLGIYLPVISCLIYLAHYLLTFIRDICFRTI